MMSSDKLQRLRRLADEHDHAVYEAVKAGKVSELSHEGQLQARAIEEHLNLPGVHNALEFADVRDGQPFEMEHEGQLLSPLAHITLHAAVLNMLEDDGDVRAAFESLTQEKAVSQHHAIHILGGLLLSFAWVGHHGRTGLEKDDCDVLERDFGHALKRICRDADFRRKVIQKFPASHWE